LAQSTSAEKPTNSWSTSEPQTPELQHEAGSNICMVVMLILQWLSYKDSIK
jgi:hypothetical protein